MTNGKADPSPLSQTRIIGQADPEKIQKAFSGMSEADAAKIFAVTNTRIILKDK